MKWLIVFPLAALVLAAADAPSAPQKKEDRPAPAPEKGKALVIPAGAVEVESGVFRFTDSDGKTWLYRKTPFGVMRFESKATDAAVPNRDLKEVKAIEDGETIRFERPSPFGVMRWQKKKSELNEMERAVWEQELARRNAEQESQRKSAQE